MSQQTERSMGEAGSGQASHSPVLQSRLQSSPPLENARLPQSCGGSLSSRIKLAGFRQLWLVLLVVATFVVGLSFWRCGGDCESTAKQNYLQVQTPAFRSCSTPSSALNSSDWKLPPNDPESRPEWDREHNFETYGAVVASTALACGGRLQYLQRRWDHVVLASDGSVSMPDNYTLWWGSFVVGNHRQTEFRSEILPHLYHFLEFMLSAYGEVQRWGITDLGLVRRVALPFSLDNSWIGKHMDHNKQLMRMVFPNARVDYGQHAMDSAAEDNPSEVMLCVGDGHEQHEPDLESEQYSMNAFFQDYIQDFDPYMWYRTLQIAETGNTGPWHYKRATKVRVVYVNRQNTERRLPDQWHDALIQTLQGLSYVEFRDVDFVHYSFQEQLGIARSADVLVGVHGNGLSHSVFMHPHRYVLEIVPDNWHWGSDFFVFSRAMGHRYLAVFGEEGEVHDVTKFTKSRNVLNEPRQIAHITNPNNPFPMTEPLALFVLEAAGELLIKQALI